MNFAFECDYDDDDDDGDDDDDDDDDDDNVGIDRRLRPVVDGQSLSEAK